MHFKNFMLFERCIELKIINFDWTGLRLWLSIVDFSYEMSAETLLYPRQAAEYIANKSVDVRISSDGIKDTAKQVTNVSML